MATLRLSPRTRVFTKQPPALASGVQGHAAELQKVLTIRPYLRGELTDFSRSLLANPSFGPHKLRWERLMENVARANPGQVNGTALADYVEDMMEKLRTVGDDAQLANIDLQNALQKQQQTLQTLSNVSKMLHDNAMAVIRKIG